MPNVQHNMIILDIDQYIHFWYQQEFMNNREVSHQHHTEPQNCYAERYLLLRSPLANSISSSLPRNLLLSRQCRASSASRSSSYLQVRVKEKHPQHIHVYKTKCSSAIFLTCNKKKAIKYPLILIEKRIPFTVASNSLPP